MYWKHGQSYTRTYAAWNDAKRRCRTPSKRMAPYYAGLTFDPSWLDYNQFLRDMGECPEGMTLDRKDGKLGYGPNNCRWATPAQQARNRSSNRMVTINDETMCFTDWCSRYGVSTQVVSHRLRRGLDMVTALMFPVSRNGKGKAYGSVFAPLRDRP